MNGEVFSFDRDRVLALRVGILHITLLERREYHPWVLRIHAREVIELDK